MFVPATAVVERDDTTTVWVVDGKTRVHAKSIEVREPKDGRREVLSGLSASDRIVVAPPALSENQLVVIMDE
jgi:hypothetical protein